VENLGLQIDEDIVYAGTESRSVGPRSGAIEEIAAKFGYTVDEIYDFTSAVNPLGPPQSAVKAVKNAAAGIGRYPDAQMRGLRKAAAGYFGIKQANVVCGAGGIGLIHLIPRVFRPRKVLVTSPAGAEYAAAARDAGSEVALLPLAERNGFHVDPVEMAFALKGADMAFLSNPNAATGQVVPKAEMIEIMRYAVEHGVRLVIDEAYMDYLEHESILKETLNATGVICLRTFSKFFGMPGLRVGYAVSDEATAEALREGQEPWTVNGPAEHAAVAALGDWTYIRKTRSMIDRERERLLTALRLLPGVETFAASANFILVKVSSQDDCPICDKLGRMGLLVRDCSSVEGLDGRFIGIAPGTRRANKRLLKAMRAMLLAK
jgi:threonine-phosphate decarboxylase